LLDFSLDIIPECEPGKYCDLITYIVTSDVSLEDLDYLRMVLQKKKERGMSYFGLIIHTLIKSNIYSVNILTTSCWQNIPDENLANILDLNFQYEFYGFPENKGNEDINIIKKKGYMLTLKVLEEAISVVSEYN
jgi:hypothetical protein